MPEPIRRLAKDVWPGRCGLPQPPLSNVPGLAGFIWTYDWLTNSVKLRATTDDVTAFVTPNPPPYGGFSWFAREVVEGEPPYGTAATLDEGVRAAEAYVARRLAV